MQVKTQAELDAAINAGDALIACVGDGTFRLSGSASVEAFGSASVRAYDSASVEAFGSASVRAYDSASVRAYDSASVEAFGSASVRAFGSASVRAFGSASVVAFGSASVVASGSASVRAYDSASVEAFGSASVEAFGSASVRASGSASVRASGLRTVVWVNSPQSQVTGGTQILRPATVAEWCEQYGATVENGVATLFKAVDDDYCSQHNRFAYTPGTMPVASDWDDGKRECGGGLHFCASPREARWFNPEATKYIACPVRLTDIAVRQWGKYPSKVKARGCSAPVWEVDIDRNRL